jgi:parallel beta-helix repeat protein
MSRPKVTSKRWGLPLIASAVVGVFIAVQAGPLEPPVPPGEPTMMPIDQVDPRIPLYPDMFPVTIVEPGSYYLAADVSTTGAGIIIQTDDVTIDLMGFILSGGTGLGIDGRTYNRITVRNGTIRGWPDTGIRLADETVLEDLIVEFNGGSGIDVYYDARIVNCTVSNNTVHGIIAQTESLVQDCVVTDNGENGVWMLAGKVANNVVGHNGRNGIRADGHSSVLGNFVHSNDPSSSNGKAGIWLIGGYNRVEGNTVQRNNIGIDVDSDNNVVVRNIVGANLVRNFDEDLTATGNFMPIWNVGGAGSPDPWANIEQL